MNLAVTGYGILSAAGRGRDANLEALRAGRDGLGPLRRFDSPRNGHIPVAEVREPVAGPRTLGLAGLAARDALADAGLSEFADCALLLGSCTAGMPETEAALLAGNLDTETLCRHEAGYLSASLQAELGLGGPHSCISTACSAAAAAIGQAADWLEAGLCRQALAGGSDALCRLTLNGFASLLNISPQGCRPFDAARDGMSLGEGAAFLVLEPLEAALARGARIRALLLGHGSSCDAFHPTAPHPEGRGAARAMQQALRSAGLDPAAVSQVNGHGTATTENDPAEARAMQTVFGRRQPALCSNKRIFGHSLGAAGALEAVASILSLEEGFVPATPGHERQAKDFGLDLVPGSRELPQEVVLSNSFGFGGNNTSLCLGRAPEAKG